MDDIKQRLVACVLHLKTASALVQSFNSDLSMLLLQTADALIEEHNIDQQELDMLNALSESIKK